MRDLADTLDEVGFEDPTTVVLAESRARVADQLVQRLKALELEGTEDEAVARNLLLRPKKDFGLASDGELSAAVAKKVSEARYQSALRGDFLARSRSRDAR